MHSQRINEAPSNTWIKSTKDGEVNCVTVIAWLGLMKFVHTWEPSCFMFYVEAVRHNKSCTDVPCSWSMPSNVNKIPCAIIADIDFMALCILLRIKG